MCFSHSDQRYRSGKKRRNPSRITTPTLLESQSTQAQSCGSGQYLDLQRLDRQTQAPPNRCAENRRAVVPFLQIAHRRQRRTNRHEKEIDKRKLTQREITFLPDRTVAQTASAGAVGRVGERGWAILRGGDLVWGHHPTIRRAMLAAGTSRGRTLRCAPCSKTPLTAMRADQQGDNQQ